MVIVFQPPALTQKYFWPQSNWVLTTLSTGSHSIWVWKIRSRTSSQSRWYWDSRTVLHLGRLKKKGFEQAAFRTRKMLVHKLKLSREIKFYSLCWKCSFLSSQRNEHCWFLYI